MVPSELHTPTVLLPRPLGVNSEPDVPPSARDEFETINAAQLGDRSAFAALVESYWDRLFRWLFQMTRDRHRAEDLTQETFMRALAALKSFRAGSNFRAWLFRIGHNNFVNLKRIEKRSAGALNEDRPPPDDSPGPETLVEDREELAKLQAAIRELPTDFRTALLMRTEADLSFKEIAAILKITEETARWRVFKARQKLTKGDED